MILGNIPGIYTLKFFYIFVFVVFLEIYENNRVPLEPILKKALENFEKQDRIDELKKSNRYTVKWLKLHRFPSSGNLIFPKKYVRFLS